MPIPSKAALQRRAKRRRAVRQREQQILNVMEWGYSRAEAAEFIDDPLNEMLCDDCGWTVGMVCPECSKGCGCERNCSGWRHGEYRGDDDDSDSDDQTECEGCGAGGPYRECVCYQPGALLPYDDEPERDYVQEMKDELPERDEPDDWYEGVYE